jgi:molybdopterin synthase catalytic subunit
VVDSREDGPKQPTSAGGAHPGYSLGMRLSSVKARSIAAARLARSRPTLAVTMSGMDAIRLLSVGEAPLSVAEVYESVADVPSAGGIALFSGVVRNNDEGRAVTELGYSAHPSVEDRLREVVEKAIAQYPIKAVSAVHRIGDLKIGDIAVIVAVACPKRGEAFDACRQIIDEIKESVPIWKHERFADGGTQWVGAEG